MVECELECLLSGGDRFGGESDVRSAEEKEKEQDS